MGLCVRWRPSLPPKKGGGAPQIFGHVYCTHVKRLYACSQIRYLCFSNYRIRVKYSRESCESLTLFVLKIDCSVFEVTVTVTSFKNIVTYRKKHLKPSLGNSNMHRRRNLDRERSASEIVSYRARVKYACARIHCTCFTYYRIRGNPVHGIP